MIKKNGDVSMDDEKYRIYMFNEYLLESDLENVDFTALDRVLKDIAEYGGPAILKFDKRRYDFFYSNCCKMSCFISNTTSEKENPDITKNLAIPVRNIKNLKIDGSGAKFIFHGKMTPLVLEHCENVEIKDITIDFARPTISEMTVISAAEDYIDFAVNKDSWYRIERDKLVWVGEGWSYTGGPSQEYDPRRNITWRTWNPAFDADRVEELEPFKLRFFYNKKHDVKVGHVFQMRDGIRDQVGIFIHRSKNVRLYNINIHYMHGLGVVSQFSEDLHFENMKCIPLPESKRTAAAFADFIHFSGCRGKIYVHNCVFSGAHDDVLNVHGTYLKIIRKNKPNEILVRFMHDQSYGFDAFFAGDEIDFIDPETLTSVGTGKVLNVKRENNRELTLTLVDSIPEEVREGDAIENVTWTPEVEIKNNYFSRIPTRGILITTRRKVVIEGNAFDGMKMSAILIADDAESWFESGGVRDVTIRNNTFIECGDPVILIRPENKKTDFDRPVHKNIHIEGNKFKLAKTSLLYAKSTCGIFISDNLVTGEAVEDRTLISLHICGDISIQDNELETENFCCLGPSLT